MIWTVLGVILCILSGISLLLGIVGIFNGEDYSYQGARSYDKLGPFTMAIIYGVVAYTFLTMWWKVKSSKILIYYW